MDNTLYYGDNLDVLRSNITDESVDLIYLDPPFNSKRIYNVIFTSPKGDQSEAQITAFEDSWTWGDQAEKEYSELLHQANSETAELIRSLRHFLKESDAMAYLVIMANRLLELHRVLKTTGSLYLHCDPTASHYLKLVLDSVFGAENFRNEIIWKRQSAHSDAKGFGAVHDVILYYVKSTNSTWNQVFQAYTEDYIEQYYRYIDDSGRKFMSGDLGAAGL